MKPSSFAEIEAKMPEVSKEEYLRVVALTRQYAPVVLPRGWNQLMGVSVADPFAGGIAVYLHNTGLKVLFSADPLSDPGKIWLHVSLSQKRRVPTYEEMTTVKKIFIGPTRQAVQIFPPEDEHINIHPYCLHLWSCLDGDGLPKFGKAGTI